MLLRPVRQIAKDLMIAITCTATQFFHDTFVSACVKSRRNHQTRSFNYRVEELFLRYKATHDFVSSFELTIYRLTFPLAT